MCVIWVGTSQTVIKKHFHAVAWDNGLSSSPSPPAPCLLSATGLFVGDRWGISSFDVSSSSFLWSFSPCLPPLSWLLPLTLFLPPPPHLCMICLLNSCLLQLLLHLPLLPNCLSFVVCIETFAPRFFITVTLDIELDHREAPSKWSQNTLIAPWWWLQYAP